MRTERKKAIQRPRSLRVWAKVKPVFVLGCAIALGVLAGKFVGGSIAFTVGLITAATALILISAGVLWVEALATRNSNVMHELTSVNWLQLTGRFWLVAMLFLGTPLLVNAVLFRLLDGPVMKLLMVLEALIVYVLVSHYRDVLAGWIVQKNMSPDKE